MNFLFKKITKNKFWIAGILLVIIYSSSRGGSDEIVELSKVKVNELQYLYNPGECGLIHSGACEEFKLASKEANFKKS